MNNEQQKLKNDFALKISETVSINPDDFEEITDFWLNKMKDEREKMRKEAEQLLIEILKFVPLENQVKLLEIVLELKNRE
jgi:hypothetical protein